MTRKAGRPSKAELEQRGQRKRARQRAEERRRQMELRIRQGLVEVVDWNDAVNRHLIGEPLPDDVLVSAPLTPAEQFVRAKLDAVSPDQFDAALRQAMIDLLISDVPLDKHIREAIAGVLWALTYPELAKRRSLRTKVKFVNRAVADAERRGLTEADAYDELAKGFGHPTGDALRKWLENHEHLLGDDA